jgi:amino acid adenylation domain-containing protein
MQGLSQVSNLNQSRVAFRSLQELLIQTAECYPTHSAIEELNHSINYQQLAELSDALRDRLYAMGVGPGDRVGIYLHKSIDSVVSIFGILKAGAAYVPVDPTAPVARNAFIFKDCAVNAVVIESIFVGKLQAEMGVLPPQVLLEQVGGGEGLKQALGKARDPITKDLVVKDPVIATFNSSPDDLAYILYTSGSTGKPKGVMLSQRAATSFVDWCSETFSPQPTDRFSSHAPFHFDLSILDIYVPLKHGATLVLVSEELGKDPANLASFIAKRRISVWYSAPSILTMLVQYGKLERYDYALRAVLFAGEVFPIKHLRALKTLLPTPRYYNLYGPTETNVCTYYEVPTQISDERTSPFPIGQTCSYYEIKTFDEQAQEVIKGQEGELCASGPGVMEGYWQLPERNAKAFLDYQGKRWYKTGDVVYEDTNGDYIYVGRRDRMIKKRGYRVELGEIESVLYRHPAIAEAAVIALSDDDGVRVKAFVSFNVERPSLIDLKRFCSENLPGYMIPDMFSVQQSLPKTSTDKIDYQKLVLL